MKQYPGFAPPSASFAVFVTLVIGVVGLASCTDHAHSRIAFASTGHGDEHATAIRAMGGSPPTSDGRVVLVTIDGVRAEDVFGGADPSLRPGAKVDHLTRPEAVMPRLHRLVATRGVALGADQPGCGAVRTATGVNVSLPGYLEIFTGRKTRCRDNKCAPVDVPTVLDEAASAGLSPVASIGSWDVLDHAVSRRDSSSVLVAAGAQRWPGSRPLDGAMEELVQAGERADAFPGVGRYRPDAFTMPIALEYLRTAAPPVLHVGLGDADEWGHRNDYGAYLEAIGKSDAFIGRIADTLDAMGDIGARTTVIVTTDHGRNSDFQHHGTFSASSARTFVMAFGARVKARGVGCSDRDVTLADIAPTVRALVGLPADESSEAGRPIEEIVGAPNHLVVGATGAGGSAGGVQRP